MPQRLDQSAAPATEHKQMPAVGISLERLHDHGLRHEPSVVILLLVMSLDDSLPTDLASAHALIIVQRAALRASESEAQYRALLIEKLKYTIRKLRHERFGQASERGALLDQLEFQLADLEEDAAQAEAARLGGAGGRGGEGRGARVRRSQP